jgi:hypothetical protein
MCRIFSPPAPAAQEIEFEYLNQGTGQILMEYDPGHRAVRQTYKQHPSIVRRTNQSNWHW